MITSFKMFASHGIVALYDEAPGGGDPEDINSLRNRPALNPAAWLDHVYFHSALDNMEVASETVVSINHASAGGATTGGVSGSSGVGGGSSQNAANLKYKATSAEHVLVTHGLGYVPDVMVLMDGDLVTGAPVQTQPDGRGRYCTVYADTNVVGLREWTSVSNLALPAITLDYRVIVMRRQPAASGNKIAEFNPDTGELSLARNRFRSKRRYLQVVPGGSPFGIPYGKTLELRNGAPRFVNPDGTYLEPVPASLQARWRCTYSNGSSVYTGAYGASMAYNGTFDGPEQILVQAP